MTDDAHIYGLTVEVLETWAKELGLVVSGIGIILEQDETTLGKTEKAILSTLHESSKDIVGQMNRLLKPRWGG